MKDTAIVNKLIHDWKIGEIVEVGPHTPSMAQTASLIESGCNVLLIEPHPAAYLELLSKWGDTKTCRIIQKAIYRQKQKVILNNIKDNGFHKTSSSFVAGIRSPYTEMLDSGEIPGARWQEIEVDAITFDEIDTGNIDLLFVDAEGCEWYVIEKMKSRPRLIKLETHGSHRYINPFMSKINTWMEKNGYEEAAKTRSDTIWILKK